LSEIFYLLVKVLVKSKLFHSKVKYNTYFDTNEKSFLEISEKVELMMKSLFITAIGFNVNCPAKISSGKKVQKRKSISKRISI